MKSRAAICIFLAFILMIVGCSPTKSVSVSVAEPDYWPIADWQSSTPEAQGMDSDLLAQMLEGISDDKAYIHSVLIIRNGYMVSEAYFHPYTRGTKMHIQSVTKSVIGMLVGKATSDGHIRSANEKLVDFYPDRSY